MKKFFNSFFNNLQYQVLVAGGAIGGMFLAKGLDEQRFREAALGAAIIVAYLAFAALLSNRKG